MSPLSTINVSTVPRGIGALSARESRAGALPVEVADNFADVNERDVSVVQGAEAIAQLDVEEQPLRTVVPLRSADDARFGNTPEFAAELESLPRDRRSALELYLDNASLAAPTADGAELIVGVDTFV